MTKYKIPRKLSLVKFDYEKMPEKDHKYYIDTFKKNEHCIFLGEIPNMPGHSVIIKNNGTIIFGWHTEDFIELTVDEA